MNMQCKYVIANDAYMIMRDIMLKGAMNDNKRDINGGK